MTTTAKLPLSARLLEAYREHILQHSEKVHLVIQATPRYLEHNAHMESRLHTNGLGTTAILNITPRSCSPITFLDDRLTFLARFEGVEFLNTVFYTEIIGLCSPADPLLFSLVPTGLVQDSASGAWATCVMVPSELDEAPVAKPQGKPALKLVK